MSDPRHRSRCSSCGALILWGRTANDKAIPLDAISTPDGNMVIERGFAVAFQPLLHASYPRYTAHFATCPHADEHRRRS